MAQNPHLQYLFTHPQFGYLYPHRFAIAALGVPNEYQLNKHRPQLTESKHYLKLRGKDHIDRLYYTLDGLTLLADLVKTPQAVQFKQDLVRCTQGGSIVPAVPTDLYQPALSTNALYVEPQPPTPIEPDSFASPPLPPSDLAYREIHAPNPGSTPSVNCFTPAPIPSSDPSPQDTASIIFQAQKLAAEQIFIAQKIVATQTKPPEVRVTVNLWQQWDNWLNAQEVWAVTIVASLLIALLGVGSFLMVSSFDRSAPRNPPQAEPTWR